MFAFRSHRSISSSACRSFANQNATSFVLSTLTNPTTSTKISSSLIHNNSTLSAAAASSSSLLTTSSIATCVRTFATVGKIDIARLRNMGISAHIDSGKTTLTERILYYAGRIKHMHEVKGKDGVGATMDSMDLERERGITIQSAATFVQWRGHHINVIDTPGHVDFTIEVERALRVLDGAILVLCGVAGVQSQSMTVDRQMKRYNVPRLTFVNKLDRGGADPWRALKGVNNVLQINCAPVQLPIGLEDRFEGVVDLIKRQAYYFDGPNGDTVRVEKIPAHMVQEAEKYRRQLIERVSEVDEELGELYLNEIDPTDDQLKAAIRRATIALKFSPMFLGSAYKNKGVQPLLDGVVDYLPNPAEVNNEALDLANNEAKVKLEVDGNKPMVSLAFKLEQGRFGQLTYIRTYQGSVRKGDTILNIKTGKKVRVPRVVRMHANEMEDVDMIPAGEIAAVFGVECDTGTTFTDGTVNYSLTSMFVPEPVMSLAVTPKQKGDNAQFGKALDRFTREDPTFHRHLDHITNQTIISGMGELHLQIYVERMRREYNVETVVGMPKVHYRETITRRIPFSYTHKKQSGGRGQFGKLEGYLEPLEDQAGKFIFENHLIGNNVPPEFHPAIEKGFYEAAERGVISGHGALGVRAVVTDGSSHPVDSSELAFRLAALNAFRVGFEQANPIVLEPIMSVEIEVPTEYQGTVVSGITRRRGMIEDTEALAGDIVCIKCRIPLSQMFGYSTDLRSMTQGKGSFTMEYKTYNSVPRDDQTQIVAAFQKARAAKSEEEDA